MPVQVRFPSLALAVLALGSSAAAQSSANQLATGAAAPAPPLAPTGVTPGPALPPPADPTDFLATTPEQVELGRLLFYDKLLSGNQNVSCATCHHSLLDTGDGLSLSVGEGGRGLGMTRDTGSGASAIHERVPRNAPPVFNLGALEFTILFHDGRIAVDPSQPGGFLSPAGAQLPNGLGSALAVQAMFPVTSATEMAGQPGENPVADGAEAGQLAGPNGVWDQLADRLRANAEYVELFREAYPSEIQLASDVTFVHAANALAAFESEAWRTIDSPFDRYLRGEAEAMSPHQLAGMELFYGKAACSDCHAGTYQTDLDFHALAMPQIGPGKGDGPNGYEDFGRERVTGLASDRFRFRTPTLRNVALTGPWGHAGAHATLEAVVRHHLDPVSELLAYDRSQAALPPGANLADDFACLDDPVAVAALTAASELAPSSLNDGEVDDLVEFLHALTDPAALDLRHDVPFRVPSGLPVAD